MDWQLVESDQALARMLAAEAGSAVVIVDTEFMRRNTFYPQVALVQLCFEDTAWLVDPLRLADPSPLARLLSDESVLKVLHSPSEDLEVFQHWLGVMPQPLFDTQRAAALLDRGFGLGYRALVHDICGIDLPKGETRSDWLQRPLTAAQCEYAAQDVAWLLPVWRALDAECVAQGKHEWVLADGRDAINSLATTAGDYYRRIKNGWKLDARQLGGLAAVSDWREQTARQRDKPRNWIIDDQACLQLAQFDPRTPGELEATVDLPAPALRRYGSTLLEILAQQRQLPDSAMPDPLPGPLQPRQRSQVKQLRASARDIAQRLAVAPEVLLQSRDYEALVREADGAHRNPPRHWAGWRQDAIITPLRELLAGGSR